MTTVIRAPAEYGAAALDKAVLAVSAAQPGTRNDTLNTQAFGLYALAAAGVLQAAEVETALAAAARDCGLDAAEVATTLASARRSGEAQPADVRIEAPRNGGTAPPAFRWRITAWPGMRSPEAGTAHTLTTQRIEALLSAPKADPATPKADLPFWAFAAFEHGKRSRETFSRATALTLDYDTLADLTQAKITAALGDVLHFAHTSPSHTPAAPKWRIVVALSRPVSADEYERLWEWSQARLPGADRAARQAYRGYYVPVARPHYAWHLRQGPPLDVDAVLRGHTASPPPLGEIVVGGRQLLAVVQDAWTTIRARNVGPELFRFGGRLARLRRLHGALPDLHPLGLDEAHGLLLRSARWIKIVDGQEGPEPRDTTPPKDVARDLLAYPDPELPPIESIVASPVLAADGALLTTHGYHGGAAVWYERPDGFALPPVPDAPSAAEVAKALTLLRDDLLGDFPFAGDADRAHALAALLLPFVRRLVSGPTPLHLVTAPTPGSGKTLLASAIAYVATGELPDARTLPTDEDETRKMLLAELMRGRPVILLDNAEERATLRSPALESAVTAETYTDRLLGASMMISAPNRALWLLTANNPRLSMAVARRCLRIRLAPPVDRPWLRTEFRHWPLVPWIRAERAALVHACLVLARAWVATGRRPGRRTLGSFESWATVVGGVLDAADVPGFLGNLEELYAEADADSEEWRAFVAVWAERHLGTWQTVGTLAELAAERDLLASALGDGNAHSRQCRLGRALQRMVGRVFGDAEIQAGRDRRSKAGRYRLAEPGTPIDDNFTLPGADA